MKAKELRIGNFVNHTDDQSTWVMTIETVAAEGCHTECNGIFEYIEPELLEPIPLTEEWLIKFGFKYIAGREFTIEGNIARGQFNLNNVKYVHQLQNLFFALCQKELTVKE